MFIVIMGVTGCGKTTVGERLSRSIQWPFFDADDYHPPSNILKMSTGAPLTDEDRAPWLDQLTALLAERTALGEDGILACSALKASTREALRSVADLRLVYLKADPELVRARLESRRGHYMPPSLVDSQFLTLEEPAGAITIPASSAPDSIVATICAQLGLEARQADAGPPATKPHT